ncbi:MAG: response regulator [Desulfovibrio sp.]|nr:MAG: response regulator [Desulfovibrio sp.]
MSHEIRTPLGSILGLADLALQRLGSGGERQCLELIRVAGESLLSVINDILDLSKAEAHKLVLEVVDFDLFQLMATVRAIHALQAAEKGLTIQLTIDQEVEPFLRGDPARLRQILDNLLANAVKFTDKGWVHIRVSPAKASEDSEALQDNADESGELLAFSVTDTGVGIPKEKQGAILESFQQADDSITREYGGTGLGLTICKRLVEAMGGMFTLDSTVGKGSVFTFTLPFARGDKQAAQARESANEEPAARVSLGPLNILFVDDNVLNRELVAAFLQDAGHDTTSAAHGLEAVAAMTRQSFDVVLMDIQMPVMDGLTAMRRLRESTDWATPPNTPVIAMTAHSLLEDKESFLSQGMDGYVAKPIHLDRLLEVLERVVLRREETASDPEGEEPSKLLPDSPLCVPLDRLRALEKLRNNKALLTRLEGVFLRDGPGEIAVLGKALDAMANAPDDLARGKEQEEALRLAHMIKGSTATIGAMRASKAAKKLEQALSRGGGEEAGPLFTILSLEVERVCSFLQGKDGSFAGEPASRLKGASTGTHEPKKWKTR